MTRLFQNEFVGIPPCGEFLAERRQRLRVEHACQNSFPAAGFGHRAALEVDQRPDVFRETLGRIYRL